MVYLDYKVEISQKRVIKESYVYWHSYSILNQVVWIFYDHTISKPYKRILVQHFSCPECNLPSEDARSDLRTVVEPKGSMYPYSICLGLKGVPI